MVRMLTRRRHKHRRLHLPTRKKMRTPWLQRPHRQASE
jgi:hypothetical protein